VRVALECCEGFLRSVTLSLRPGGRYLCFSLLVRHGQADLLFY
jgi:hypothetical protein